MLFDIILNHYGIGNEFITNIDEIITYSRSINASSSDIILLLKKIYDYNTKYYETIQSENKVFAANEKLRNTTVDRKPATIEPIAKVTSSIKKIEQDHLNTAVNVYFESIRESEDHDVIIRYLPHEDVDNWEKIINLILLRLLNDKLFWIKCYNETKCEEERELVDIEISKYNKICDYIIEYRDSKSEQISGEETEIINSEEAKTNNIIFMQNSAGKPLALGDIGKTIENYPNILELLTQLHDNTFKVYKKLNGNTKVNGLLELRYNSVRIIYQRLECDTYVVLAIIPYKNFSVSLDYHVLLAKRKKEYDLIKGSLKEVLQNQDTREELLTRNYQYFEELRSILNKTSKVRKKEDN